MLYSIAYTLIICCHTSRTRYLLSYKMVFERQESDWGNNFMGRGL